MKSNDEAMGLPNARLLSAIYFGLLALVITIIIDAILYLVGSGELIPTFKSVLLATIIAIIFGALFGEKIVHCREPYRWRAFLWGFFMVLAALPFYDLFFLWLIQDQHSEVFAGASLKHWAVIYLVLLFYSFIVVGLWLAILAGFAAMYLRGQMVYDIMHSEQDDI